MAFSATFDLSTMKRESSPSICQVDDKLPSPPPGFKHVSPTTTNAYFANSAVLQSSLASSVVTPVFCDNPLLPPVRASDSSLIRALLGYGSTSSSSSPETIRKAPSPTLSSPRNSPILSQPTPALSVPSPVPRASGEDAGEVRPALSLAPVYKVK